jgi:ABC-type polysaccharide/polyol phosphate export permease
MQSSFRESARIVKDLAVADFKLKYNRSILGFFWSLLKPLLMLATLYVIFHMVIRLDVPHYELFLLLGIILWGFLIEATGSSMSSLIRSSNLIKKTFFDKRLIVLSTTISAFISLMLNLIVFVLFLMIFQVWFSWHIALFILLLAELFIFTLGMSYLLSSLYVRFRDITHIWDVLSQIGFWVTPIIYPLTVIPEHLRKYYILNPLARIIEDSRNLLVFHTLPPIDFSYAKHVFITLAICLCTYFVGAYVFNRMSKRFAEQL